MRIVLVNMPLSSLRFPSMALSQLAAVVRAELADRCHVEVIYANHRFARLIGRERYELLVDSRYHSTGVGEWIFRAAAFPESLDNTAEYLARYLPGEAYAEVAGAARRAAELAPGFCADLAAELDLLPGDVLGLTSMFAQTAASIGLGTAVKRREPGVITALGGANCETAMGVALAEVEESIDAVFSGPALVSFPKFLSRVIEDGSPERCHAIPGVLTAANCGNPIAARLTGPDRPLASVVEPDFSAFREEFDLTFRAGDVKPILFFETSRGCWWGERAHCTFCGLNGSNMGFREMPAQAAVRQFQRLFEFAPWCESFHCVDNIMPTSYIDAVFPELDPPVGTEIFFEIKVGHLSHDDLKSMARAGVTLLQPGIEALYTPTLKLMHKGTSSFQNITFLAECKQLGIQPLWSLLIGFPGEAETVYDKYAADLPLLGHLPPPMGVFTVRFDRYSPYFTQAEDYGLRLRPFDFYRMTFPYPPDTIKNLAYYFDDVSGQAYQEASLRRQPELQALAGLWHGGWSGGPHPVLRLEYTGTEWTILDTRGGAVDRLPVTPDEVHLLHALSKPVRLDRLQVGGRPVADDELGGLRAKGLVFEENGRMMTLVENILAPLRRGEVRQVEAEADQKAPGPGRDWMRVDA
jgi:ribosomal peptide maturation radical SAM protein 1